MSYTETAVDEQTNAPRMRLKGTDYFRLGETDGATGIEGPVVATEFESMVFQADRDITDEELYQLSGLLGFLWKMTVKGERLTDVTRLDERMFLIRASIASSTSRNAYARFDDFVEQMNEFVADGSPVKKDGSQLVEGVENVKLSIWVDSVTQELERKNFSKLEALAAKPSPFAVASLSGKTADEIANKVKALVSIKDSLTPGEQDILTMAHDLMVAQAAMAAKLAEAEAKLEAVRSALG